MKKTSFVLGLAWHALLCSALLCWATPPAPYTAMVVDAHDGDTVKIVAEGGTKTQTIRVLCIDTPEEAWAGHWPRQPGADLAQARVARLALGQRVTVHPKGAYTYGRLLASIELPDKRDLATVLIQEGLGWARCKVNRPDMEEAKAAKIGIWRARAIDPSKWRKGER